jgi:hypothetical protein
MLVVQKEVTWAQRFRLGQIIMPFTRTKQQQTLPYSTPHQIAIYYGLF